MRFSLECAPLVCPYMPVSMTAKLDAAFYRTAAEQAWESVALFIRRSSIVQAVAVPLSRASRATAETRTNTEMLLRFYDVRCDILTNVPFVLRRSANRSSWDARHYSRPRYVWSQCRHDGHVLRRVHSDVTELNCWTKLTRFSFVFNELTDGHAVMLYTRHHRMVSTSDK